MSQWVILENCTNPLEPCRLGHKHNIADLDVDRPAAPVFVEHNEVMIDREPGESRPQPRERGAAQYVSPCGRETTKCTLKVTDEGGVPDAEVLSDKEDVLRPWVRERKATTREG